jgi:hypothetical protein
MCRHPIEDVFEIRDGKTESVETKLMKAIRKNEARH